MNYKKPKTSFPGVIAISVISMLLFLLIRGLGFDGLYGQDSYEYLRYANALFHFFSTGESPGDYFWPLYYPLIGSIVNFVFQDMALTLSVISLTAFTITAIYLYKIIALLYTNHSYAPYFIVLCFIFSPAVYMSGMVVMSDMLSACFIILSIFNVLKFSKYHTIKSLYFIAIFATCAVMTRYASFLVLFPFGILILFKLLKNKRLLLHLIPILILVSILILPHIYIRSDNVSEFLNHSWLKQWSFGTFFKSQFDTPDGIVYNKLPNIIYAFFNLFHPRYIVIGIVLIMTYTLKGVKFKPNKTILIAYILYSLFLAGLPCQNSRYLILNFSLALILLFPAFQYVLTKLSAYKIIRNSTLSVLLLIQVFLCFKTVLPFHNRNQLEKSIVTLMKPYQDKTLYSFDIDLALKGRQLNFDYKNLWIRQYNEFTQESLVLFNAEKFKEQWKGKNPMLNWTTLKNNYNLKVLEDLPKGWKLYQIMNKKKK